MQVIGIQVDGNFARAAFLQKKRGKIKLCTLKSASLSDASSVKQLYLSPFKGNIVSGLPIKDTLTRFIELKISDTKHFQEALKFHADATTHFNPAEIISIPFVSKKNNGNTQTLLFTTARASLRAHLLEMQKLGIDPDRVSAHSMALVSYMQWRVPSLQNAFLIDLGYNEWTCSFMERGKLKKAHSLPNGTEGLLTSLWEDRKKILLAKEVEGVAKQIDLLQLKSHFNPHLSIKINEMRQELTKIIFSFHRISGQQPVVFLGQIDAFGHLPEFLTESFKEAAVEHPPIPLPIEEKKFAIPIGLGLEHIHHSLQFLQREFFPKKNWRRTGLYSLLLFASSIFLSFMLIFFCTNSIESRKSKMIQSLHNTLEQWAPELKQSIFSENTAQENILNHWISTVSKHNKEYPYLVQAPKMYEVLNWLNQHPFLKQALDEKESIHIEEIHYQLVEYPTIESPQEPYLAKVELEFKTSSPMNARKFHELLLKGDAMVDPSLGIQWEMLNEGYRTSFFLKNRTPYVP